MTYDTFHNKKSAEAFDYDPMGNRTSEIFSKVNKKGKTREKEFSYSSNTLNQYTNREVYKDIPEEVEEETGTGKTLPEEEEIVIEMEGKLLYDPAGNLIGNMLNNKRQYIYSYDYKNRLVQIEKNIYKKDQLETTIKVVEITYDVLGRRIQKKFNNGAYRNYIYSNQDIVLEHNYSKKDKLKNSKQFIYGNQVDDILSMIDTQYKTRKIEEEFVNKKGKTKTRKVKEPYTETSNYYYQKDHLGSIIAITDESANIVEEYVYDVFGKPYSKHADGTITHLKKSPIGNTRLYTGREYDRGLQLYYNRARYYNPQLGRFISRDPIDIVDDVNLYGYVGNNSVMFVDRMGLAKDMIISLFRQSGQEMSDFRSKSEWDLWKNDWDPDLNFYYFNAQFSGLGGEGKYDLALYGDGITGKELTTSVKGIYDCYGNSQMCDGSLTFDGAELNLGEISNVLTALNASRLGFSQDHLEFWAMGTVMLGTGNQKKGELADRKLYDYGYLLGELEQENGKLTDDEIIKHVKKATVARKIYLTNTNNIGK